jgi:5,10-methylenetetrahydromethanopterin reductase
MQFGISFGALYAPTERIVKLAEEAERYGFDYIWLPDSQLIYRDPYMNLALIAEATTNPKLGTLVTSPLTRHPSVIACAAVTLDEISGGRAVIGLGAGDSSVRRIGLSPSTSEQLREAIEIIRRLCRGESVDFRGARFGLRFGGRRIPIYIVATGLKMLSLGGSMGDGVVIHSGTYLTLLDLALKAVKRGAEEAGRKIESLDLAHMGFCAISEDRFKAYEEVKPSVMWFLVRYPHLLKEAGLSLNGELLKRVKRFEEYSEEHDLHHSGEWVKAMKAASFLPDKFAEALAYAGTPEDISRKIREVEARGFKQVIIRPTSTEHWESTFKAFAEQVIPNFR